MAAKRPRDDEDARASKKHKKGFSVGPANLPDGVHKRKVQKIKREIIHKSKIKKDYAKLKAREQAADPPRSVYEKFDDGEQVEVAEPTVEPTLEPHPDRQVLLDRTSPEPTQPPERPQSRTPRKRPRPQPFSREAEQARLKAREEAEKQREQKLAERERYRKVKRLVSS
ncbi:hypothetical protein BU16DRAFT_9643 [Lophium mytilinum]|uniref:rRNA-processing protein FYV7 n=1 Tax=Lophium mytilinum TaxID=390894 RepID=A0A6A6RDJ3_9PEZI|nr:hypothetical protein BU16DRAFT_9643 [Lophium mytilinum]